MLLSTRFSNVQLKDPRKELKRSIEVELILKRLRHKKLTLRTPDEVEKIFNASLSSGLIRTVHTVIAPIESEIAMINLYDSMVSDYFLLSKAEAEDKKFVYQTQLQIPPTMIHDRAMFLKYDHPHYLGYDLHVILEGSGHDRMSAFLEMETSLEKIKQKFGIA